MSLRVCLRCDRQAEADEPTCPNCGVPLYELQLGDTGKPTPTRSEERTRDAARAPSVGPADGPSPALSRTDAPEPSVRSTPSIRTLGVLGALALTLAMGFWLGAHGQRSTLVARTDPAPIETPAGDASPTPTLSSSPTPGGLGRTQRPHVGRNALTVDGVPMSFTVRRHGWEHFGAISINKSTVGPQGAEAMIFWTSFPGGQRADPCARLRGLPVASSVDDLALAVSTAPGIDLLSEPSDATVGRRDSQHVVLVVLKDLGCDPGYFYSWRDRTTGALWPSTNVGDTIRVWIVRVHGTVLFIEAETTMQASAQLEHEIERIVGSIRFE